MAQYTRDQLLIKIEEAKEKEARMQELFVQFGKALEPSISNIIEVVHKMEGAKKRQPTGKRLLKKRKIESKKDEYIFSEKEFRWIKTPKRKAI